MTFQQIKYVLEIYHTGSLAAAAQKLYLVPSSLSIALGNLEQELGCKIFQRTKKGMTPTPEGLEIIGYASRIYNDYQQMTKPRQHAHTHVRIAGFDGAPTNRAFVRLMEECKNRQDISFSKTRGAYKKLLQQLSDGELELALMLHNAARLRLAESAVAAMGLNMVVLKKMPLVAFISPAHPLYKKEDIDYRELENYTVVDRPDGALVYNDFLRGVLRFSPEKSVFVNDVATQAQLVEKGLAYSIGPGFHPQNEHLRQISLGDLQQVLTFVYNPAIPILPEVSRYLELLKEELE